MTILDRQSHKLFSERIQPWLVSKKRPVDIDTGQGVYIYGAGDLGLLALDYCESCNIPVLGILDRSRTGVFRSKTGRDYIIASPDSNKEDVNRAAAVVVTIATLPFGPIRNQLHSYGWEFVFPFYNLADHARKGHPLQNGWKLADVTQHEFDTVEWLCRQWSDKVSWRHYEAFIAWHCDNTEVKLSECPINTDQRYVIPELLAALASSHQQFVDVGSHRGETIARLNRAGLRFDEYILIEPDELSRSHLSSHQHDFLPKGSRVSINEHVLGKSNHLSTFKEGLGYCSQIWGESKYERRVIPLDELELTPDFIKVHTEGTEWDILQGAKNTVLRSRPCLAFSVYHRREGFYNDIAGAMELFHGYQWFFRLHSYQGTGGFVYAVPD
jgi:FkbM family methyltransferase